MLTTTVSGSFSYAARMGFSMVCCYKFHFSTETLFVWGVSSGGTTGGSKDK